MRSRRARAALASRTLGALSAALLLAAPASRAADPAPEDTPAGRLFGERCTSCHTLGEGDKVGPDLLGVTDRRALPWIGQFLRGPGKLIDSGDPTAAALFKKFNGVRMPDQNLADAEIAALLEFFAACTAKKGCHPSSGPKLGLDATPEEIALGRALFTGEAHFSKGGPACIECHSARGVSLITRGMVGGDLTFAWARLHDGPLNEAIGAAALERAAYGANGPTDAEKFALRGYFADLARDGSRPPSRDDFVQLGFLAAVASLGAVGMVWSARVRDRS
ncbi:MAG: cytochrome c [Deltaproteobacteria bacterium]|nr:cytochrome c [Deltaproteobacteria bacterium]